VLNHYLPKVEKSTILSQLNISAKKYFIVSIHREENIISQKKFTGLCLTFNKITEQFKLPIIVTTHPRTRKMIKEQNISFNENVRLEKPFALSDYLALQINARAVLSDSGTISEEASILGFPALNIREAHERPEATEETAVIMTGLNLERILQGLTQLDCENNIQAKFRTVTDYKMSNVSDKIVRIILSYTDYVKRVVWNE
jgi:UDP-N-acetylglucosamine 2-epimerase (non-hydrolysing)